MADTNSFDGVQVLTCTFRTFDQWRYRNLSAPYWRVYWNDRPGWQARLGETSVDLGPRHLVVIPPETPFSANSTASAGHLYLHFVVAEPFYGVTPALYREELDSALGRHVGELVDLARSGRDNTPRALLLARLLCLRGLLMAPASQWRATSADTRVANAMRTMELMVENPPSNALLAREAGMNTNAFIRLFTTTAGMSPKAWYSRHRIDYACRLLHHSRLSIDQIAQQTGYCDRAHFSRVFRAHRGVGPAEFRKRAHPEPSA